MIDVTENTILAFGSEIEKLSKTQSNYCHGLHIPKTPHTQGMKNTSNGGAGHGHYFLKKYEDIKLISNICTMLQDKENIFNSFLLHFNTNRFYEQSIKEFVNIL